MTEIDVFFPDGTNACGEKHEHCSLRLTGSAKNIVPPAAPIKIYLEKKYLYLSRMYLIVHCKCNFLDLDFINSDDVSFDYSSGLVTTYNPYLSQVISTNLTSSSQTFASRSVYLESAQKRSAHGDLILI